jgi:hypothetical protein
VPQTIDEHQAVRFEIGLALEPVPAPFQDVRTVLLRDMRRLFLRVIWRR